MTFTRIDLPTDWTLRLADGPADPDLPADLRQQTVPATVPGCVHTDLLAADLIPDPYLDRNELQTRWIGKCDWVYATQFQLDADTLDRDALELVCEGLDTLATLRLNGQEIGRSDNMHRRHRFDLKAAAQAGNNELEIHFAAAEPHALAVEQQHAHRPSVGGAANPHLPHHMIRKMACNFGWDWGPQLVTAGIWRPLYLEAFSHARLGDVRPLIHQADTDLAKLDLHVDLHLMPSAGPSTPAADTPAFTVTATLHDPDGREVATASTTSDSDSPAAPHALAPRRVSLPLTVEQPRLWWPRGYGDQPLYRLEITLADPQGNPLHTTTQRLGLRTSQLVTDPDAQPTDGLGQGETFHLLVNGQRVFCKGANWIPDDCFPHRVTPDRYRARIQQATDAHMNMLRVWGGGTYEDHAFYEVCDETGVLVWQDFLMACACYAEEEPFWSSIGQEAADNVSRLAKHPSLVLWNGCNENIWGTYDWAQPWIDIREKGEVTWGLNYYLELFPQVVEALTPTTPYWPASPFSGNMDRHPNANEFGNRHVWDVWNGHGDYRNYLGHFPRFASEFGYQGPCTMPTLRDAVPPDQRHWLSDSMIHHNKQIKGQERALDRVADDFDLTPDQLDEPDRFADTWFLTTLNQCRALTLGCEWFRALSPWCSGALYWQLNDCWPVTSWAAIDGQGRPKLLLRATRNFFRDRLITVKPATVTPRDIQAGTPARPDHESPAPDAAVPGPFAVYLHNDSAQTWSDTLTVTRHHVDGRQLDQLTVEFTLEPRANFKHPLPEDWSGSAGQFILAQTADADASSTAANRGWHFFGHDRDIPYPAPDFSTSLSRDGDTLRLTVTSPTLVRDLCLLADHLDPAATVTDAPLHLLPGESHTFTITGAPELTQDQLTAPHILRCINPLA